MTSFVPLAIVIFIALGCNNSKTGNREKPAAHTITPEEKTAARAEWTTIQKEEAINECLRSKKKSKSSGDGGSEKAKQYCSCMTDVMASTFTHDEYRAALSGNNAAEEKLLEKLNAVKTQTKACKAAYDGK